jgi:hypothetical protein
LIKEGALPALRIPTRQTSSTPIHDDRRLRIALQAHGGAGRVAGGFLGGGRGGGESAPIPAFPRCRWGRGRARAAYVRVFFCAAALVGRALLGDQAALLGAELFVDDHADVLEVVFDHGADLGDDTGHVDAAGLEVAAARVEYGLQLFHQEGDVAALAEHGAHDARDGDHPLEVVHVLRVDEDLEGTARFVLAALVEHDVVDRHVQGVLEQRGFDLVGAADQHFRALDALVHLDDVGGLEFGQGRGGGRRGGGARCGGGGLVFGLEDGVALDFLADLDGHVGTRVLGGVCGGVGGAEASRAGASASGVWVVELETWCGVAGPSIPQGERFFLVRWESGPNGVL